MFITFEGPEGSGKTTQIRRLADFLLSQGRQVLTTRQPGGTEIGLQIRHILHDVHNSAMTPEAEILLYAADRAQHVGQLIRPALAAGQIVLCDRYVDSTIAYQGYGRGLDLDTLAKITKFATGGLQPDLTFFLDIEVSAGLARRESGQVEMNRMDLQQIAFYERVYQGYETLIKKDPQRWRRIDANQSIRAVQEQLQNTWTAFIADRAAASN
ncbi:MAG: dTMP kinase [Ardenticatenaceae bacterium]|nr:dTMP kinase [Ardenticatenaceae bacterium]